MVEDKRCKRFWEGRRCMKPKGHGLRCEGYWLVGESRHDWWVNELERVVTS